MGLKKKSKVSAEFNMSSLTDIIFLLLIFFMLTSSLINPNAINLKLPSSSKVSKPSTSKLTKVRVGSTGRFYVNGKRATLKTLDSTMRKLARDKGKNANVVLEWSSKTGVEHVVTVMDLALKYHVNTILAAEK
ncbi:MAG: biopolymer transporter ExbD [Bacteroidota bacterium]